MTDDDRARLEGLLRALTGLLREIREDIAAIRAEREQDARARRERRNWYLGAGAAIGALGAALVAATAWLSQATSLIRQWWAG